MNWFRLEMNMESTCTNPEKYDEKFLHKPREGCHN